uniref:Carrier domain-containing protein n=1 Tax=Arcella intermedia TaxID=1963864 RepID=A0A6B2KX40_9EUKA
MSVGFAGFLQSIFSKDTMIAICGINCVNWYIADYATLMGGFVSVPIHWVFDVPSIAHIMKQTKMPCAVVTNKEIPKFIKAKVEEGCASLRYIITMDNMDGALRKACQEAGIELLEMNNAIKLGKSLPFRMVKRQPTELITLTYTSGSTGLPKGTMKTDSHILREIGKPMLMGHVIVTISFGPLAHGTQRNSSFRTLGNFGRIGIFSGDMSRLLEDTKLVKPSSLVFPPRIYTKLYNEFQQTLAMLTAGKSVEEHDLIENNLRRQFCEDLGGRIWNITTGGAPTSPEVIDFLRKTYSCSVDESYGTTEIGAVAVNGTLVSDVQAKLVDVPELGYHNSDKPLPRGELWIKSSQSSLGYYQDHANTKANFDDDGWVNTGDIVEYNQYTRNVKIIDRRKNIFKLAQSEFVAPEKLELIFLKSTFIENCFVYGNSSKSYVLAVVVPSQRALQDWIEIESVRDLQGLSFEDLCNHPLVNSKILESMQKEGRELRPYEIPKAIYLESEPFTPQNSCLTPSFKLSRAGLTKKYRNLLEDMYKDLDAKLIQEEFRNSLIALTRSYINVSADSNSKLVEIGLDSVSAIKISSAVKDKLKVNIPIELLFNPDFTIEQISSHLAGNKSITESIDWEKEIKLPEVILNNLKTAAPCDTNTPIKNIFLTGVTGVVGAFLLDSLIKGTGSLIYCLVRGNSENASKKFRNAMKHYRLWETIKPQMKRITIIPGDLSEPLLGMEEPHFQQLSQEIDAIFHSGAQVNGVLPYSVLKKPNVNGTIELLKLATTTRVKLFYHISTMSVFNGHFGPRTEDAQISTTYLNLMSGYGASKLVSEKLLQEALKLGLPLVIYRLGTITGDTKNGATNVTQFINRYIEGIIQMGCAPDVSSKYDMLPADLLAQQISLLSEPSNIGKVFHLFNLEGALTVNMINEYVREYGYKIEILPYPTWKAKLVEIAKKDQKNELTPLVSYFTGGFPSSIYKDNSATCKVLGKMAFIPVTKQLIHKYISFFAESGVILYPST